MCCYKCVSDGECIRSSGAAAKYIGLCRYGEEKGIEKQSEKLLLVH